MVSWHDYNLLVERLEQLTAAIEAISDQQQRIINALEDLEEHYNKHIQVFNDHLRLMHSVKD